MALSLRSAGHGRGIPPVRRGGISWAGTLPSGFHASVVDARGGSSTTAHPTRPVPRTGGRSPETAVPEDALDDPQIRAIRCANSPLASHGKTKDGCPAIPAPLGLAVAPGPESVVSDVAHRHLRVMLRKAPVSRSGRNEVRHAVICDNSTLGVPRLLAALQLVVRARQAKACQAPDRDDWPDSGHHRFYALSLD